MTYKYHSMNAPVALEEIESKLPLCSFLCPNFGSCPYRVTLNTIGTILVVDICLARGDRP